jgi:hypothetical protein
VNAKGPEKEPDISSWLRVPAADGGDEAPDVVCCGMQEIVDLNAMNVAVDKNSQNRSAEWEQKVAETLRRVHPAEQYKCLGNKWLVGIQIVVFVRAAHERHCTQIQMCTAGVGIMGMMGNKGGAAIRMHLYDSPVCFVCAHLAAHRDAVPQRNADFAKICQVGVWVCVQEARGRDAFNTERERGRATDRATERAALGCPPGARLPWAPSQPLCPWGAFATPPPASERRGHPLTRAAV